MPFGIGTTELLIIGIIAIILFGNRLPSVAPSLGRSLNEFKKGMREFEDEMRSSVDSEPAGRVTYHDETPRPAPRAEAPAGESAETAEPAEARQ